jgi:hypothetical protein
MRSILTLTLVLAGCTFTSANDKAPVLLTSANGPGNLAPKNAVVGVPFPVQVAELALPGGNCGLAMCPPAIEPLTLVEATCDGGACTARNDGAVMGGSAPAFIVTPTAAGPTTVHVTVRRPSGETLRDELRMTFLTTATIGVNDHAYKRMVGRTRRASLVGTTLEWLVTLDAPDGTHCAATADAFTMTIDGDAFGPSGALENEIGVHSLAAARAGTSHVRFAVGTIARDISLRAIDPADVTAVELHTLTTPPDTKEDTIDVEAEDGVSADPLSAATVSVSYEATEWVVVVRTSDGTLAVGGADRVTLTPSSMGELSTVNGGTVVSFMPHKNGGATLTAAIGAGVLSVPVTIATK